MNGNITSTGLELMSGNSLYNCSIIVDQQNTTARERLIPINMRATAVEEYSTI